MRRKDWRIVTQGVRASVTQDVTFLQICSTAMCIYIPSGSAVKTPPAMQEMQQMQGQSLGWEDHQEQEMATHCRILAWRIHGQRSLAGCRPRVRRGRQDWAVSTAAAPTDVCMVSGSAPHTQKLLTRNIKTCRRVVNRGLCTPCEESLLMSEPLQTITCLFSCPFH